MVAGPEDSGESEESGTSERADWVSGGVVRPPAEVVVTDGGRYESGDGVYHQGGGA